MPAPGPGVCIVCRGPSRAGQGVCFACRIVARRLGLPLVPVVPARLCPIPGALYAALLGYKESAVDEERRHLAAVVRALCRRFLADSGAQLGTAVGGAVEMVVPVPSSVRAGLPPLARLPGIAGDVHDAIPGAAWVPTAVERGRRSDAAPPLGHMTPDARGFVVREGEGPLSIRRRRVVLLDDLYVSGSRAQSAAAALRLAGAASVVIAPLGRVLRPDRLPAHRAFLARHVRPADDPGDRWGAAVSRPVPGSPTTRRVGPPARRRRRTARD